MGEPFDQHQYEPASGAPPARPRRSAAVPIAVLALVVALCAALLGLVAIGRAGDAKRLVTAPVGNTGGAVAAAGGTATTGSSADLPTPTDSAGPTGTDLPADTNFPTDTGSGPPPTVPTGTVQPVGTYKPYYQRKLLRIPTNDRVDLDQPRVFSSGRGDDISYTSYGIYSTLPRAQVSNADASPADCDSAIQTAPLNRNVTPSVGLTLCIVTDPEVARSEGISQKLFLITVTSIAKDDTINVTASAWETPH